MDLTKWKAPKWTESELDADRETSLELLNSTSGRPEGRKPDYFQLFDESAAEVERLLAVSDDLQSLTAEVIVDNPDLLVYTRMIAAPPVSHDDLERLCGKSGRPKRIHPEFAKQAVPLIVECVDDRRFPWLPNRAPTDEERTAAVLATSALVATERWRTKARNSARRLETAVQGALKRAGLVESKSRPRPLPWTLKPGSFCGEATVGGTKCDVIAHLASHERALLCECKTSSTKINGTKRLKSIQEAAETWRRNFGAQVVVVGVISGDFELEKLLAAQASGVFLVWEHDLEPLEQFAATHLGC